MCFGPLTRLSSASCVLVFCLKIEYCTKYVYKYIFETHNSNKLINVYKNIAIEVNVIEVKEFGFPVKALAWKIQGMPSTKTRKAITRSKVKIELCKIQWKI